MSFKAEGLRVGDVLENPLGTLRVIRVDQKEIHCQGGLNIDKKMVQTWIKRDIVAVHRDGKQIYPVSETAHTDADVSANSNREEG